MTDINRMDKHKIKFIRSRMGLTQSELAELMRLSRKSGSRTIRRWEAGERVVSGPALVILEMLYEKVSGDE